MVTELDVRAADDSFPAASRALTYCRQLVAEAVGSVGASGAALYSVDGTAVAALLVEGVRSDDTALERVALDVLREGRPLLAVADPSGKAAGASSLRLVGLPISMDDELIAVCVLERPGTAFETVGACSARLAGWVLAIALAADRLRIESALSGEVSALKRQLDAYALDFRATYLAERDRSQQLAAALAELERTYKATVRGLAIAVEAKDECTGGHLQRVCRYGMMLTSVVAPEHAADPQYEYGFLLHDIGKLTVPDVVLTKPGPLDDEEWELIKHHPESGRAILDGIPFLAGAQEIVHAHHERWDGKGYPRGLARDEIPLGAQIFPLCDAFDAMTSDRPYRKALSANKARANLLEASGTQFWPDAVDAFVGLPADEVAAVQSLTAGTAP